MMISGLIGRAVSKVLFVLTAVLLLLPCVGVAQTLPCNGDDPYTPCDSPLDTYVWVLALVAAVFTAIYLQRKQKAQTLAA